MGHPEDMPSPWAGEGSTHDVVNQVPPLRWRGDRDDPLLQQWLERAGAGWALTGLERHGERLGEELGRAARWAERCPPVLFSHDPQGHRIDVVEYHEGYHRLLEAGVGMGMTGLPWQHPDHRGRHVVRAAHFYLQHQLDAGSCCPLSMTFSAVPALRHQPELAREWEPLLCSRQYDGDNRPWYEKPGATLGMAMTEKQGGTDVAANATRARPVAGRGPGREYRLTGHKWFCSAPMSDGFLVLAQAPGGLSCLLMPRWQPDGRKNPILIQRLKDKLGNRSNASAEIELTNSLAWLVGEEGRGVATIMSMVALTRADCVTGSAALMRRALVQAVHHCRHRRVMGRRLLDQPLMRNVLADLALESRAALHLAFYLAEQIEQAEEGNAQAERLVRLLTAVAKYWVCRRTPAMVNEAAECLGGAGYIEEFPMAWLYREAPLNAIWEGCSNVQCLDVLRALDRDASLLEAVHAELDIVRGASRELDLWIDGLAPPREEDRELLARHWTARLALAVQAMLLWRFDDPEIAQGFARTRLGSSLQHTYGTLTDAGLCDLLLKSVH